MYCVLLSIQHLATVLIVTTENKVKCLFDLIFHKCICCDLMSQTNIREILGHRVLLLSLYSQIRACEGGEELLQNTEAIHFCILFDYELTLNSHSINTTILILYNAKALIFHYMDIPEDL